MERLISPGEVRAEGRTLHGVVMTFGEVGDRRERFKPGSLVRAADTWLDLGHDVSRVLTWEGAGLTFTDDADALRMRAELPRTPLASLALEQVRAGSRRALSVEFEAVTEYREAQTGVRVIELANLHGVGLVESASFPSASVVEVRRGRGPRLSGRVNLGRPLSCRCRTGCDHIQLEETAFDAALQEAEAGKRVVTVFLGGNYSTPLAALGKGLTVKRRGKALEVEVDGLPDTEGVREFLEARKRTPFVFRPYFPDDTSEFTKEGRTATFTEADLRAIEIAPITGPMEGLEKLRVGERRARLLRGFGWL